MLIWFSRLSRSRSERGVRMFESVRARLPRRPHIRAALSIQSSKRANNVSLPPLHQRSRFLTVRSVVNPSWIRTPLIEKLTSNPDFKDPVLEAEDVSSAIVKQVLSGRSAQLILPKAYSGISTIRAWPAWMQVRFRNRLADGLNDGAFGSLLD